MCCGPQRNSFPETHCGFWGSCCLVAFGEPGNRGRSGTVRFCCFLRPYMTSVVFVAESSRGTLSWGMHLGGPNGRNSRPKANRGGGFCEGAYQIGGLWEHCRQSRLNALWGDGPAALAGPALETPTASKGREMGRGPPLLPISGSGEAPPAGQGRFWHIFNLKEHI